MSGWQTIESAPKDGTSILAYGPAWCGNKHIMAVLEWYAHPPRIGGGMWNPVGASGYEYDCDLQEPTHWMPLPSPPDNF